MGRCAAIVPAYNEGPRIGRVLEVLVALPEIGEVIVVDDGSEDNTAQTARQVDGVRLIRLESNRGKGGAMVAGVAATDARTLLFLDADLIGLTAAHVREILEPVVSGVADMSVGVFRSGRAWTDLAQILVPYISGQRAMAREVFASLPNPGRERSGIETLLTIHARAQGYRVQYVPIRGVTHAMKEEKLGIIRGLRARARMYAEIIRALRAAHRNGRG